MDTLPDELLLHILKCFHSSSEYSPADLAAACLLSRRLNRVGTPVLYSDIRSNKSRGQGRSVLYRLLETLQARPHLRLLIKRLEHCPPRSNRPFGNDLDQAARLPDGDLCDASTKALIDALANELQLRDSQNTYLHYNTDEDILLTLCALLAPNVERIKVRLRRAEDGRTRAIALLQYICESSYNQQCSQSQRGGAHSFERLRQLQIEPDIFLTIPSTQVLPLLLLPSLKHLTVGGWGDFSERARPMIEAEESRVRWRPQVWPIQASSISELCLRYPQAPPEHVSTIIMACKALTKLECTKSCIVLDVRRQPWYGKIDRALSAHSRSLRELLIWEHFVQFSKGQLSCLPNMTALTRLQIPWHILTGNTTGDSEPLSSILPPGLQKLTIEIKGQPELDLGPNFAELHESIKAGSFAHLARIHLLWRQSSFTSCFNVAATRARYAESAICFDVTITFRDAFVPTPRILHEYQAMFPAYVRYMHGDLAWVPPDHFIKASTCFRTRVEHDDLMSEVDTPVVYDL
ncbi:hypothetical protein FB567DRAFT_512619 [Paraphoma chrysanthemicola]|uniref:F-box domain-containing protein n=1 Tax=Paraphoma chrysanthemicola TaxID=798071 RepID=A0A8K0W518_9PLEO|nr:hypothetical protein FB567DRAFT_512619 [Paraphoma chrysanthemicola]